MGLGNAGEAYAPPFIRLSRFHPCPALQDHPQSRNEKGSTERDRPG